MPDSWALVFLCTHVPLLMPNNSTTAQGSSPSAQCMQAQGRAHPSFERLGRLVWLINNSPWEPLTANLDHCQQISVAQRRDFRAALPRVIPLQKG